MGKLEHESGVGDRRALVKRAILASLLVGGVLAVGVMAPNAIQMIKIFNPKFGKKRYYPSNVRRGLGPLLEKRYVEFRTSTDGKKLTITSLGKAYLAKLEGSQYRLAKPKKWDKKYRVVIFDIKEGRRGDRDKLRRVLRQIGFLRLQDSVWVYPHDCEDVISLIKADFKIGKDVLYMIVDSIEYDKPIREYFELPVN